MAKYSIVSAYYFIPRFMLKILHPFLRDLLFVSYYFLPSSFVYLRADYFWFTCFCNLILWNPSTSFPQNFFSTSFSSPPNFRFVTLSIPLIVFFLQISLHACIIYVLFYSLYFFLLIPSHSPDVTPEISNYYCYCIVGLIFLENCSPSAFLKFYFSVCYILPYPLCFYFLISFLYFQPYSSFHHKKKIDIK